LRLRRRRRRAAVSIGKLGERERERK